MTVPQPKRDEKGNVLGRFYPLQIEELFALRKLKVLTNAAYVHLALRYENPFCDRPIEIFPKEFALRWQMPESSVYEAIAKLKEINAIEIKYGKVVIEWKKNNAESTESIDVKGYSQQDSQQENQDSQQDALSGNSESCQPAESKVSEISNKILDSQKEERIVRKDSGSSEKPIYIDRARSLDSSEDQTLSEGKTGFSQFWAGLVEEERERFEAYCKAVTANYQKPVVRIKDWLASTDKAGESRWESLYKEFKASEAAATPAADEASQAQQQKREMMRKQAEEFLSEQNTDPDRDKKCVPAPQKSAAQSQEVVEATEVSNQPEESTKESKTEVKGFGVDKDLIEQLKAKRKKSQKPVGKEVTDNDGINAPPPYS